MKNVNTPLQGAMPHARSDQGYDGTETCFHGGALKSHRRVALVSTTALFALLLAMPFIPAAAQDKPIKCDETQTCTSYDDVAVVSNDAQNAITVGKDAEIVINGGSLTTLADGSSKTDVYEAVGVYASAGGKVTLKDVTITTSGKNALGIAATDGGIVSMDGGVITTSNLSAYGVYAEKNGTVELKNVVVTTTGRATTVANATYGGSVRLENVSLSALEDLSNGVLSFNSSSVTMKGGSIETRGENGAGVWTYNQNARTDLENVDISTFAYRATGISAAYTGVVTMNGGTISTVGDYADGAHAYDVGHVTLENVAIRTSGSRSFGLQVREDSTISMTSGSITTQGEGGYGVVSWIQGTAKLNNVAITTAGPRTVGVLASEDGLVVVNGGSITTTGAGAAVAVIATDGTINLSGVTGKAASADGIGLMVDAQTTSSVFNVANSTITAATVLAARRTSIANFSLQNSVITGVAETETGSQSHVSLTGSRWAVTGSSALSSLTNQTSTIAFDAPMAGPSELASYKILTVDNYVGNGGTIILNSFLGGDGSPSDRLVVTGVATGSTALLINNTSGEGAPTIGDGIIVVETIGDASTTRDAFRLGSRVAAGAYEYTLHRGGSTSDDSWYLRSTDNTGEASIEVPAYRVEVPLMAAVTPIAMEYGYAMLGTLHERRAETWITPLAPTYEDRVIRCEETARNAACVTRSSVATGNDRTGTAKWASSGWARLIGDRGLRDNDNFVRRGPDYDYTSTGIQAGLDLYAREQADGTLDKAGLYVGYGHIDANVKGAWQGKAGSIDMDAYTIGAYWTHFAPTGWYTDAVVQGTWYDADAKSLKGGHMKPNGFGFLASLEAGYSFKLGGGITLEPQAQLVYQNLSFDNVADAYGRFNLGSGDSTRGRLGLRLAKTWNMADDATPRLFTTWLRANIWYDFSNKISTTVTNLSGSNPVTVSSSLGGTWAEIGAGVSGQVAENIALFATGAYNHSLDNRGREAWNGRLGVTLTW